MNIKNSLIKFGLTKREASVYLACLELGKSKVQEIAKKAELPRSTTYSVLESLINKQLIFTLKDKKITEFNAEDPQKILNLSEESTKAIKNVFPDLKTLYRSAKGKPKIRYYEGMGSIKEMYNDILRMKGLKEYQIIAAEKSWMDMDHQWFEDFKQRRAQAKIRTRLILEECPEARQRQKAGMKYLSIVKIMPTDFPFHWGAGIYIFSNRVIFIQYEKDVIAVEIESKEIAGLQKLMFESIWFSIP